MNSFLPPVVSGALVVVGNRLILAKEAGYVPSRKDFMKGGIQTLVSYIVREFGYMLRAMLPSNLMGAEIYFEPLSVAIGATLIKKAVDMKSSDSIKDYLYSFVLSFGAEIMASYVIQAETFVVSTVQGIVGPAPRTSTSSSTGTGLVH